MYGYVYIIYFPKNSFRLNGIPFYIGQKKGKFNENYWGSGRKVRDWMRARGVNSRNVSIEKIKQISKEIKREILAECESQEELNLKEFEFVNQYINNPLCLNLCNGGSQNYVSEELREKISTKTKEAMWREDVRQNYINSLSTRFTEETYKKMSEAAKKDNRAERLNKHNYEKNKKIWADPVLHEKRRQKMAKKTGKKVKCIETGVVYDSISNATKLTGIFHIADAAAGKRKHAGGFHWEFV